MERRNVPTIRRSLIIGLGGSGLRTTLHIKKALHQHYGQIPKAVKFLVLDTTPQNTSAMSFNELGGRQEVRVEPEEFLYMPVENPLDIINASPSIQSWWPEGLPTRAILNGAGQIRALGRLAVHAHADEIMGQMNRLIDPLFDLGLGANMLNAQNIRLSERRGVEVYIIGSLAGGTCSGCFIDIAFLMRHLTPERNCNIYGYLILPWIFQGLPATSRILGNTYAALKELDYYMDYPYTGQETVFRFANRDIVPAGPPYKMVNLIDGRNEAGENVKMSGAEAGVGNLCELISKAISLNIGAIGQGNNDVLDNIHDMTAAGIAADWGGKNPHYSSFGVSTVVYPMEKHFNRAYNLYAMMLIDEGLRISMKADKTTKPVEVEKDVQDFTTEEALRDEGNQVIDSLVPPKAIRTEIELPLRSVSSDLKRIAEDGWHRVEQILHEMLNKNLALKIDQSIESVNRALSSREAAKGAPYALAFVDALAGQMESYREKSNREIREFEDAAISAKIKERELLDRAQSITILDRILRKRRSIYRDYVEYVSSELDRRIEIERRKAALKVFQAILGAADDYKKGLNLTQISQNLSKAAKTIEAKLFTTTYLSTNYGEYSILIEPLEFVWIPREGAMVKVNTSVERKGAGENSIEFADFLKDRGVSADFNTFLADSGFASIGQLGTINVDDLREKLISYSQDQLKFIQDMSLEDILLYGAENETERRERLQQILRDASSRAKPLWSHQTGNTAAKMEEVFILGVENEANTRFRTNQDGLDLLPYLVSETRHAPNFASTTDPWKLYCLQYKCPLPAYLLHDMDDYRKQYYSMQLSMAYHVQKGIELSAPDLFPFDNAQRSYLRTFVLAASPPFGVIKITRGINRAADKYQYAGEHLGNSMQIAMDTFMETKRDQTRQGALDDLVTEYKKNPAGIKQGLSEYLKKRQDEFTREKDRVKNDPTSTLSVGQEILMWKEIEILKEFLQFQGDDIHDFIADRD